MGQSGGAEGIGRMNKTLGNGHGETGSGTYVPGGGGTHVPPQRRQLWLKGEAKFSLK